MIFRVNKTSDYTVMSNHHFRNAEMSLRAKGLLSLMLSLPDEWDFSVRGLEALCNDGADSIRAALRELERFHYLVRYQGRDDLGKLGRMIYDVYEKPFVEPFSPRGDLPHTANPCTDNPHTANPTQLNTKDISITKESKTKRFTKPTVDDVRAYIKEIGASFTAEAFIDHYEANGWKIGKSPMKDWRATVRNWKRRDGGKATERAYDQDELRSMVNDPLRDYLEADK